MPLQAEVFPFLPSKNLLQWSGRKQFYCVTTLAVRVEKENFFLFFSRYHVLLACSLPGLDGESFSSPSFCLPPTNTSPSVRPMQTYRQWQKAVNETEEVCPQAVCLGNLTVLARLLFCFWKGMEGFQRCMAASLRRGWHFPHVRT